MTHTKYDEAIEIAEGEHTSMGHRCRTFAAAMMIVVLSALPVAALEFDTIYITNIDTHGAVVVWNTDAPTNGQVAYGLNLKEANRVSLVLDSSKGHRTFLGGLLEGEYYVVRITARDTGSGAVLSNWYAFRTLGIPAPKVVEFQIEKLTIEGGTVVWKSNIPVRGLFECGYDTTYKFKKEEKEFGAIHQVTITRFAPRRRLLYRITGEDDRGLKMPEWKGDFLTAENNVAVGAPVTGTFIRNPEPSFITDTPSILSRVTDGLLDYYKGMSTSGDPSDTDQWVEIDLGRIEVVKNVLTYWRELAYPQMFTIRASINQIRWDTLGDTFNASTGELVRSRTGDPVLEHIVDAQKRIYRYVRVEIPKGSPYYKRFDKYKFVQLFELKVYPQDLD